MPERSDGPHRVGRAKPMSREDRRIAIMDAIIPLIVEHGRGVTTKQMAEAAGVAEGTIYTVFDDKDELIDATVHRYFEFSTIAHRFEEFPAGLPIADLVERVVDLTQHRVRETFALLAALGFGPGGDREGGHAPVKRPDAEQLLLRLADLLTPYRDQLAVPPRRAAQILRIATLSMSLPMLTDGETFTPREIAELLLHGIIRTETPAETMTGPTDAAAASVPAEPAPSSTATPTA